jgi:hypothetical protein
MVSILVNIKNMLIVQNNVCNALWNVLHKHRLKVYYNCNTNMGDWLLKVKYSKMLVLKRKEIINNSYHCKKSWINF